MALKALLLRKRLDAKQKELETLRAKTPDFVTREAELTQAIDETETDEQRSEVETMITEFEAERDAHTEAVTALEREIGEIETELAAEEAAQNTAPPEPASEPAPAERTRTETMSTRNIFSNMGMAERDAFFAREDVKNYISEVRGCIKEKRALTNVGLTIPPVMLGLLARISRTTPNCTSMSLFARSAAKAGRSSWDPSRKRSGRTAAPTSTS